MIKAVKAGRALVLRAPGINCEKETAQACRQVGFETDLMHINSLLKAPQLLLDYSFLVIPGGFSYGDDLGAGTLLAKNLTIHLGPQLRQFIAEGRPVLGICNGFQVLVRAGLLPGTLFEKGEDSKDSKDSCKASLIDNTSAQFECRWITLRVEQSNCIFTQGIEHALELPVAHGEGQFVLAQDYMLARLRENGQVPLVYTGRLNPLSLDEQKNETSTDGNSEVGYPDNPNGSTGNIAGICNRQGNVLGLMPHPERFISALQHPQRRGTSTGEGDGLQIFKNAYEYAQMLIQPTKVRRLGKESREEKAVDAPTLIQSAEVRRGPIYRAHGEGWGHPRPPYPTLDISETTATTVTSVTMDTLDNRRAKAIGRGQDTLQENLHQRATTRVPTQPIPTPAPTIHECPPSCRRGGIQPSIVGAGVVWRGVGTLVVARCRELFSIVEKHRDQSAPTKRVTEVDYAASGVDIIAADTAKILMADAVRATHGPEVLAGMGAFAGIFKLDRIASLKQPALVASTDGVGTKTLLAAQTRRFEDIGFDLVNHSVNDLLTQGASPLFFMDYLAMGKLDAVQAAAIVRSIAEACQEVGCALLGGETAEMPDVYLPQAFDLAGTIVGVVEQEKMIKRASIRSGDILLGLPSSGLHTNGYSLARRVFAPYDLNTAFPELGEPLVDALLRPHRCYLHDIERIQAHMAAKGHTIKGMAHITGGGFEGNISRILPPGLQARIDPTLWHVPPIFSLIARLGQVSKEEMYRTFNMGIGMVLALSAEDAQELRERFPEMISVGTVREGNGVILEF